MDLSKLPNLQTLAFAVRYQTMYATEAAVEAPRKVLHRTLETLAPSQRLASITVQLFIREVLEGEDDVLDEVAPHLRELDATLARLVEQGIVQTIQLGLYAICSYSSMYPGFGLTLSSLLTPHFARLQTLDRLRLLI